MLFDNICGTPEIRNLEFRMLIKQKEIHTLLHSWMQIVLVEGHFFTLLLSSLDDLEVFCHSGASGLIEGSSRIITYPAMDSTTAGKDPKEVMEAKVVL